ncbi:succinate dehydrogenase assembly factor 2 [Loktanella sp. SALINAS62]|uniref:succinate dehydrogenase assembly factor 2 n=1 Tax=Loktanella sp. SALINAS62 TaxID=2706124 RepID=UPI001B8A9C42|nr:succinate dehydrogenase assembly factor 2 [Loktanella sp. SALINAS62]MBS1303116.1 succinate dehydrogenase assembly factor 2 [Loktanella sp. SALINAS62]
MTETADTARKRLAMRSMRRGIKEMDLILSAFAAEKLADYDMADLQRYDALLDESDLDIYRWVSRQEDPPQRFASLVADIAELAHGLTSPRHA